MLHDLETWGKRPHRTLDLDPPEFPVFVRHRPMDRDTVTPRVAAVAAAGAAAVAHPPAVAGRPVQPFRPRPQCKCGSFTHKRTNHRDCPLNPRNRRRSLSPDDRNRRRNRRRQDRSRSRGRDRPRDSDSPPSTPSPVSSLFSDTTQPSPQSTPQSMSRSPSPALSNGSFCDVDWIGVKVRKNSVRIGLMGKWLVCLDLESSRSGTKTVTLRN